MPGHRVADDPRADDDDPRPIGQRGHVTPPSGPSAGRSIRSVARSGEIHHDRLELRQALDREPPADPAEAALRARAAAERQVRLPVVRALVDVDPSGASRLGEPQARARDRAVNTRGEQAVAASCSMISSASSSPSIAVIGTTGPERLLAGDLHRLGHPIQDRGLEEQRGCRCSGARSAAGVEASRRARWPRRPGARPSPRSARC